MYMREIDLYLYLSDVSSSSSLVLGHSLWAFWRESSCASSHGEEADVVGNLLDALIAGKTLEDKNGDRWVRKPDGTLRLIRNGVEMPVNDRAYTLESFLRWTAKADVRVVEEGEEEEIDW